MNTYQQNCKSKGQYAEDVRSHLQVGWLLNFTVLALLLTLCACGGGGGSSKSGDTGQASKSLLSIAISADATNVKVGQTLKVSATATYSDGSTQDVSSVATWSTADVALASVSSAGTVKALSAGTVRISASLSGFNQAFDLNVLQLCRFTNVTDGILVSNAQQLRTALANAGGNGKDDIIYINGGTYIADTPFVYDAKGGVDKISLIGCDKEDVVFDGLSQKRVFHFQKNGAISNYLSSQQYNIHNPPFPSLLISKLTVKNGKDVGDNNTYGRNGGGMLIERYTTELDQLVFTANYGQYWGGGFAGAGDLTIRSSRFTGNTALQAGSAFESCGSIVMYDTIVEGGNFSQAFNGVAISRTICVEANYANKNVSIYRSTFRSNGGALGVIGGYGLQQDGSGNVPLGEVLIEDSIFQDNARHALDFVNAGNMTVRRTQFLRNGPRKNSDEFEGLWADCTHQSFSCSWGGAIAIRSGIGILRFEDSEFTDNNSPNYGGAIFHGGGNCELNESPCLPLLDPRSKQPSLVLVNTLFKGNRSHRGAAVSIGRLPGGQGFQFGNAMIVGGAFENNVATVVVPSSGKMPIDGLVSSVLYVGGQLTLCGQTSFQGNLADKDVFTLGGDGSSANCPTPP